MPHNSKVIFITGASTGIGQATAKYLAKQGCTVYGTSRNPESLPMQNDFTMLKMDVTDDVSIRNALNQIIENESKIDILINNAGFGIAGAVEDTSLEEARQQFETNFFGIFQLIKSVLPMMQKQKSGLIINISSIGGLIGLPYQSLYSATKFAVEGLTEAIYKEIKSTNVNITLVEPGDFKTDFTARRMVSEKALNSDLFKKVLKVIENDENNGKNPEMIGKLIYEIINKTNPRLRYSVGAFDQKLATALKRLLPNRLFDWIIMKHYKLF